MHQTDHITIHPADNVYVNLQDGHKYAKTAIAAGENVIKYGCPIGTATVDIQEGAHVHSHNLRTRLAGKLEYTYQPVGNPLPSVQPCLVQAYLRKNGEIGIRNDIWVINTVGCINGAAGRIAAENHALSFPHPYGCSQLGDDFACTAKILSGLIRHPNAGGVLVLGLGCENTNLQVIKEYLGEYDEERIRFLNLQDCADENREASRLIRELRERTATDKRVTVPVSALKIGMKCGGSDGLSGITANPLVGRIANRFAAMGASVALTEVPEMFGAEQLLFERCADRETFEKAVRMINRFKDYFISHDQPVSENPSPGNKAGGITTLEEKSLGCVQKGGAAPITDVLDYGDSITKPGLSLLSGPGNDMVAATNLAAAGCHLILFTTGRGTPLGAPIPTVKIATNTALYRQKPGWIDFDAQPVLSDDSTEDRFFSLLKEIINGKQTCNEKNHDHEIAIFKNGVTL